MRRLTVNASAVDHDDLRARQYPIEVDKVSVTYSKGASQQTAIENVSLTIGAGKFVSIVGPSGCGKTTLLMTIAGLLSPTTGTIRIGDVSVDGPLPDLASVVFQENNLLPWRTVQRNVALPLEVAGVEKAARLKRAEEAVRLVGLEPYLNHHPSQLSGGMKQRISLARSLITEPAVLLMDEPFVALDEQSREERRAELLRVWERLKTTVVFITHSLSEAIFLADEVVVMGGRPAGIRDRFDVPFDRPRDLALLGTPEFASLRAQLHGMIRVNQLQPSPDSAHPE